MTPALLVSDLTKSFGALTAVKSVSLRVEPGERRAVIGTNGAGKSTLFNLIAGDYRPTLGTIQFFGDPIENLPAFRRTRMGVCRTYQTSRVLGGLSVLDNLYLAVRGVQPHRFSLRLPQTQDILRKRCHELADRVGLSEQIQAPASDLSHGEQRQLEIGMALAGEPRLLLLDEPAAGLSPAERPVLTRMLLELPADVTVILVEHDMDVALNVATRVAVMNEGAIVFEGSPRETADSDLVQSIYLGRAGRGHAAHSQVA